LTENELNTSIEEKEANEREFAEQQKKLDKIASQYEKLKTLLDQKGYSRARRENTRTYYKPHLKPLLQKTARD
jgi:hypothetical protein